MLFPSLPQVGGYAGLAYWRAVVWCCLLDLVSLVHVLLCIPYYVSCTHFAVLLSYFAFFFPTFPRDTRLLDWSTEVPRDGWLLDWSREVLPTGLGEFSTSTIMHSLHVPALGCLITCTFRNTEKIKSKMDWLQQLLKLGLYLCIINYVLLITI